MCIDVPLRPKLSDIKYERKLKLYNPHSTRIEMFILYLSLWIKLLKVRLAVNLRTGSPPYGKSTLIGTETSLSNIWIGFNK